MKRVLGLDLGSGDIGWGILDEYNGEIIDNAQPLRKDKIVAAGCRIVPLSADECNNFFSKGQALTKNATRTKKRSQRKGYDRYQLRRALLVEELRRLGLYGDAALRLSKLDLWGLRAKAVQEQVSLLELGRILCHINQKRGYRTIKSDYEDKKRGEYVESIKGRYRELKEQNLTIGQYMYAGLVADEAFRCKERIYPRDAYMEEYGKIMECQSRFYPEILTTERITHIRDYIIFHQRPLKSCKHLVSHCELERHDQIINGRVRNCGPKVAPRSSPLFQVCKIWESINNLKITNKFNDELAIPLEYKRAIFDFMNTHEKIKATDLKTLLKPLLKEHPKEWLFGKAVRTGLQGNTTYCAICNALGDYADKERLLQFDLHVTDTDLVDTDTGEVVQIIDASFEQQPLYILWHTLYSVSDIEELRHTLTAKFGITDAAILNALCAIDFVKSGYGNKSSRAMRKILPYLQQGMQYYEAKLHAGYDDTPLNKEQNEARVLADALVPVQRGELRQPVVEKILNQLVNVVNELMQEYGRFDEIRIELARELKQSKEERKLTADNIEHNTRENERIAKLISTEYNHLTPTRSRIQKYKLWKEANEKCIYCDKHVDIHEFLLGYDVEVEHIIPRSVLFDDSFSNKVCSCRKCNQEKNNRTAYDYMESKGEDEFNAYIQRVNSLLDNGNISKTKYHKLLTKQCDLPDDFIERQLRESQYIAKKAKEMLLSVCRNVYATSGSITAFLRNVWGWDDVLHDLNLERYRAAGLTTMVEQVRNGKTVMVERIANWTKRMDHRHHAVDALVIACTKQSYIQRINNLSSLKEVAFRPLDHNEQGEQTRNRLTQLERYILMQPHFSTSEVADAVSNIAVSFKGGKRATSCGKRYIHKGGKRICVQRGIIIPRGALSNENVYGRIRNSENGKQDYVIKYKVGDIKLKKDDKHINNSENGDQNNVIKDKAGEIELKYDDKRIPNSENGKQNNVVRKNVESVVDTRIRKILRERLKQFGGNSKKAFAEPVLDHQGRAIRSVRCYTGLTAMVPLRSNEAGEPIAFVQPCNNHHVAIYEDDAGMLHEHIATFWHVVERRKYGMPAIITDPTQAWDMVTDAMPESFRKQLPPSAKWRFRFSMQQNEMFVLGMSEEAYREAMDNKDYASLSKYLYRVQTISTGDYVFRHHLETTVDDTSKEAKQIGKFKRVRSMKSLLENNPHKVHVSVIGKISELS